MNLSPLSTTHPRATRGLLAVAAAVAPQGALACTGPEVKTDTYLAPHWGPAVASLRGDLKTLRDVDPCGQVSLFGAGDAVVAEVALPDGRATTRRIGRPDELLATVGSLLLLPPPAARPAPAPAATAATAPGPVAPRAAAPAAAEGGVHVEGGGGFGLRLSGGNFFGPGLAGFAQVTAGKWLLGVGFRTSLFDVLLRDNPQGFYARTAALSAQLGRRLQAGGFRVDLAVGPMQVLEREEQHIKGAREIEVRESDVRVAGLARLTQVGGHIFGALDGEISPTRVLGEAHRPHPLLPALPTWSVGLTVGAVGVLF